MSYGLHKPRGREVGRGMSKEDGDLIALMVLRLVTELVQNTPVPVSQDLLDRNVRPEPPEATLGHMPRSAA